MWQLQLRGDKLQAIVAKKKWFCEENNLNKKKITKNVDQIIGGGEKDPLFFFSPTKISNWAVYILHL